MLGFKIIKVQLPLRPLLTSNKLLPTVLADAYEQPFIGDAPDVFIKHLTRLEESRATEVFYAKVVNVIQSSGTGKSRMLSEVGQVFVLSCPTSIFSLGGKKCIHPSGLPSVPE